MSLSMKLCHGTKAHISDAGYFVIIQEDWAGEEISIILSPDQIQSISAYAALNKDLHAELWASGVQVEAGL